MPNKAHSQFPISKAKTITVRTDCMQRCIHPTYTYFLPRKKRKGKKQVVSSQAQFLWFFRKWNVLRDMLLLKLPIHVRWLVFSTDYYIKIKLLWNSTGLNFFHTSVITWDFFIKLNFIKFSSFSSRTRLKFYLLQTGMHCIHWFHLLKPCAGCINLHRLCSDE